MTERELVSALMCKLRKELNEYEQETLTKEPKEIYMRSYRTAVLTEIFKYVQNRGFLSVEEESLFTKLLEEPNASEYLYGEYIKTDVVDIYFEIERLFKYLGEKAVLEEG